LVPTDLRAPNIFSHPLAADKSIHPLNSITITNGRFHETASACHHKLASQPGKSTALASGNKSLVLPTSKCHWQLIQNRMLDLVPSGRLKPHAFVRVGNDARGPLSPPGKKAADQMGRVELPMKGLKRVRKTDGFSVRNGNGRAYPSIVEAPRIPAAAFIDYRL
jgi:hypothetical protein